MLQRGAFSQELIKGVITQTRKHTQIYKATGYGKQDIYHKREVREMQSRLEGIRRFKERFLLEDKTDEILDAFEHIMKTFRQLVKR